MKSIHNFEGYLSPFSWRYASQEMRQIWSEHNKRLIWRMIWVAAAEVMEELGQVQANQVADLRAHMEVVELARSLEIEAEIHHDVMAEVKSFAEQCPLGGGIIHLGMTSMDVVDNADVLRTQSALDLTLSNLRQLLEVLGNLIDHWADEPIMAFTHLQPAEPTTLGYRLALYGQDILFDLENLSRIRHSLLAKGFKGAVGTGASYLALLGQAGAARFERRMGEKLKLRFFNVTSQVYPRRQDYHLMSGLAGLGASLHKMAFDLRILQSPPIGELSEPFSEKQVGSSAMPFKKNPIRAEKIDSLARYLAQLPRVAWDNAAHSLLERTLDDSANRRIILPEGFLAVDELIGTARHIFSGLQVNRPAMARNLKTYGPFAAVEKVLMALAKAGADRQRMHEKLRQHALEAWRIVQRGGENPLQGSVISDPDFLQFLPAETLSSLTQSVDDYVGWAPARARETARVIKLRIHPGNESFE